MARKQIQTSDFKHYIGDVNLEDGGLFINLDDWEHGYAECLRITDLDSGCGYDGAVMVERISVIVDRPEDVKCALEYCGIAPADMYGMTEESRKLCIVDACASYGLYDVDMDYHTGICRWIIQTDPQGPMQYDGWKATIKLHGGRLIDYLYRKLYFQDFE